ncbi:MAG: PhoH family protein [Bacteroidota bacterium]
MTQHTFFLEGINPLEIYGVNDLRLHQIKQEFPEVKVLARGDELRLWGEEARVEKLKGILASLFTEIRKRGNITQNQFNAILSPTAKPSDRLKATTSGDDPVLVHGSSGLLIRPRNTGQREIVQAASENDIVFATGPAGTGKTYIAVALAVKALKEKNVKKIILCRPAVEAGESLGFLPGDLKDKVDPYLRPLYDALEDMLHSEKLKHYLDNNIIEIAPLAYMRGRTLNKAFVILDEAQNATEMQLKMFLTRMGEYSRMIITGDDSQVDLPYNQRSGLVHALHLLKDIKGIGFVRLTAQDVVRHPLVRKILGAYEKASS